MKKFSMIVWGLFFLQRSWANTVTHKQSSYYAKYSFQIDKYLLLHLMIQLGKKKNHTHTKMQTPKKTQNHQTKKLTFLDLQFP